jgi:hypothetical protein
VCSVTDIAGLSRRRKWFQVLVRVMVGQSSSQSRKVGTTLEFLINFGFRKPALRVGIIPAGRNSTSTVPSLAGQAQAGHTLSLPGTVTPSPLIEWYLTPLRCPAGVQPGPARAARRDRSAWRSRGGAEVVADGAMAAESRASSALPALAAEAS